MFRWLATRQLLWITTSFFVLCGAAESQGAVLLTPYDEGHNVVDPYHVNDPVTGQLVPWHVELVPFNPIFLSAPTNNFKNVLSSAFPNWTFRYSRLFTGNDLALSDNSLIVHEYSAIKDAEGVGADLSLEYQPHGDDPTGDEVHWIQVVQNNHGFGQPHGTLENIVDNNGVAFPYYDVGFPGNAGPLDFTDQPRRDDIDEEHWWTAELFLVHDEGLNGLGGRQVAVYDGFQWGWENKPELVPEPSSCMIAGIWSLLGGLCAWRPRAASVGR